MPRREKVVKPRGTDEVFIESDIATWVRISKIEIKINDTFGGNIELIGDKLNQASIMFTEDFSFLL